MMADNRGVAASAKWYFKARVRSSDDTETVHEYIKRSAHDDTYCSTIIDFYRSCDSWMIMFGCNGIDVSVVKITYIDRGMSM